MKFIELGRLADRALADKQLFDDIVEHRRKFIGLKGVDYSTLCADKISIVPPEGVINEWKQDYIQMCNTMMYGDYPDFDELMAYILIPYFHETAQRYPKEI